MKKNIIFSGSTPSSSWTKSNMKADKDENKQILKSDLELFILPFDSFFILLYRMRQEPRDLSSNCKEFQIPSFINA